MQEDMLRQIAVLRPGSFASLRMTSLFLSFWGKYATAASGRGRKRICGGEWERKEAL